MKHYAACKVLTQGKCTKLYMEKLFWKESVDSQSKDVEWLQCEHVHKPGHISQLELQINDLEKVTDKHQNKSKLHDLKERLTKR
jgi:hypothetical protein